MKKEAGLFFLGRIVKPHGIKGGFLMEVHPVDENLEDIEFIYLSSADAQWIPYRIDEIRNHRTGKRDLFFVKLKEVETRTEAEALRDREVMTDKCLKERIIETEDEKSVLSYQVVRSDETVLGDVVDIVLTAGRPVLVVQATDKTVLVPWVDEYVTTVCNEMKQIITKNTKELEALEP